MMGLAELFHFQKRSVCEGLLGRSGLAKIAQREMDRAEREGEPLALMLVEIDHFDRLRSTCGAPAGDRVMDAVAVALTNMCGIASAVARLRSAEFAVLLPGRSKQELSELAERLRARTPEMIVNKDGTAVTVSVGIGMFYPGETSWTQMLSRADIALFCAKNNGFNRVVMDSGSAKHTAERRARMLQAVA
jgi:diguanylate cyclase (GGDEF)-like protein